LLVYNVHLVDACNCWTLPAYGTAFVNILNAMTYSKSIVESCGILQAIHEQCLERAKKHGASFASNKYVVVNFTNVRTKHNTSYPLTLPIFEISPSPSACLLAVTSNKKLSCQPHMQHIK
jgi:hypothetical protein